MKNCSDLKLLSAWGVFSRQATIDVLQVAEGRLSWRVIAKLSKREAFLGKEGIMVFW